MEFTVGSFHDKAKKDLSTRKREFYVVNCYFSIDADIKILTEDLKNQVIVNNKLHRITSIENKESFQFLV